MQCLAIRYESVLHLSVTSDAPCGVIQEGNTIHTNASTTYPAITARWRLSVAVVGRRRARQWASWWNNNRGSSTYHTPAKTQTRLCIQYLLYSNPWSVQQYRQATDRSNPRVSANDLGPVPQRPTSSARSHQSPEKKKLSPTRTPVVIMGPVRSTCTTKATAGDSTLQPKQLFRRFGILVRRVLGALRKAAARITEKEKAGKNEICVPSATDGTHLALFSAGLSVMRAPAAFRSQPRACPTKMSRQKTF